ncbi:unnamed protein product [Orchesella dallaii]|uniref:Protein kinase domain-containing protein n=1 Tax=Orchesella dallaii TaxID=48710 RepID=A0ABP1QAF0_9HEXA
MSSCIKDNDRCHYDGSLGYCCSSNCLQLAGQSFGNCVPKPTSQPTPNSSLSTTASSSCIADDKRCHFDGRLGYCCSGNCLQSEGQEFGKCLAKPTTEPSTTSPTPHKSTSSPSCLGHEAQCKYDGSLGNCCSFICAQLEGQEFGYCKGSSPPTVPDRCVSDGSECKLDGTLGICCSKFCNVIAPHIIGFCTTRATTTVAPTRQTIADNNWIIYVSVSFVVLTIVAFIWLYFRQRKLESKLSKNEVEHFFNGDPESASLTGYAHEIVEDLPYNKDLEIPASDFFINKDLQLGSGCFGLVLAGTVKGADVAVKTIRNKVDSGSHLRSLLSEIKILQYIGKIDNVVNMVGCNTADLTNDNVYLFLEYCKLGSLEKYLRTNKYHFLDNIIKDENTGTSTSTARLYENSPTESDEATITHSDLLTWSSQITNAMRFLAAKKVIHADLATRNVLLLNKECAKITDFGLSRRLYDYSSYVKRHQEPLPWRWMALESLQHLSFSHQSDVWSLGITLWEIYTLGDVPYPGLSWTPEFMSLLEDNLRPNKPARATEELYDIMLDCWKPFADTRPTFEMVYKRLEAQKQILNLNILHPYSPVH